MNSTAITLRLPPDVLGALDAFVDSRHLDGRPAAIRAILKEKLNV